MWRVARDALASVIFPAGCRICERVLDTASRLPICEACLDSFQKITKPLCARCGRPMISAMTAQSLETLCHLCRTGVYDFDAARSFALYDEQMVRAILMLKHQGIPPLGVWFAKRLAEIIARDPELFAADVVVPVPLHATRRRERGYNQAELVAKPLAKYLHLRIEPRALVRSRPRPGVLRLTRKQRWETVHGAFTPGRAANVDNRRVLLLDDVFTTGATLDSCSRELRRAGATRVIAITVARAAANWWGLGF